MRPQARFALGNTTAPGDGNALTYRQARLALVLVPRRLLLAAACITGLSAIAPPVPAAPGDDRPGIFLERASVPRAKGLALDAALIKGWHVVETERTHVIFETILEEPASMGPPSAVAPDHTLLRIRADFVETPAGVNAYLYAEEIWYAGSSKEWSTDVTPKYRANLTNALSSLQSQWEQTVRSRPAKDASGQTSGTATRADGAASAPAIATMQPKVRVAPIGTFSAAPAAPAPPPQRLPQPTRPPVVDIQVGTWAYHAEKLAIARGCTLNEIGAELISGDSASELHRVHCQDGTSVLVRCDREICVDAR